MLWAKTITSVSKWTAAEIPTSEWQRVKAKKDLCAKGSAEDIASENEMHFPKQRKTVEWKYPKKTLPYNKDIK